MNNNTHRTRRQFGNAASASSITPTVPQTHQREHDKAEFIDFLGGKSFLEETETGNPKKNEKSRTGCWPRRCLGNGWKNDSMTFESFCIVATKRPETIATFKKRLTKDRDARNYQATLGELRAFANLLELGMFKTEYRGIKRPGCDFLVSHDGTENVAFQVEVFTMQDRPNCTISPSQSETEVCPFGIPTIDSNVTLEMACKIHSIKERTRQVSQDTPALLYVDFQSMFPFGTSIIEHCVPLLELNGEFTSGGIWLSFFGQKGQSVLENASRHEGLSCPVLPISGLFSEEGSSPFAGAVFSFPRGRETAGGHLVFFENPYAEHPLNPIARAAILKHPYCNLQYSRWSATHFQLIDYIEQQNNWSEVLFAELKKGF